MKKINKLISILLVLAMMLSMVPLSFTAFAATPTLYDGVTSGTKTETSETHIHIWKDATCTEPQTCSSCGVTQGDALGHTNLRFGIDTSNGRKAEYRCGVCGVVGTVTLSVQNVDYDGNPHGATTLSGMLFVGS